MYNAVIKKKSPTSLKKKSAGKETSLVRYAIMRSSFLMVWSRLLDYFLCPESRK